METDAFIELVSQALDDLPEEFQLLLDNVEVVVELWPTREQLDSVGLRSRRSLLGLYEGIPRTERGIHYGLVTPDKISIFQRPIEYICTSDEEIRQQVQDTVIHEIGHHFGISEERMEELERSRDHNRRNRQA